MKHAFIFPGQGAQFTGMGKHFYDANEDSKALFEEANDILGFRISDTMFTGTDNDLKKTNITQPAIFIHSVAAFKSSNTAKPDMVAGHSLGEFSALVASGALSFANGLQLVAIRASAMQKACEANPSAMAAIINLDDETVEEICRHIMNETGEIVVPANYNCPGQLVISGSLAGIELACSRMKEAGAKRALVLPVGGAFHSPLMMPAKEDLAAAINNIAFNTPICPVYQNVVAAPVTAISQIKENLIAQLTGPVKWTQCMQAMIADGATHFMECGPGKVLQGLVVKNSKEMMVDGIG